MSETTTESTPPTSTLLPELGPDAKIRFGDAHRPTMLTGEYIATVTQSVAGHVKLGDASLPFRVRGPRFSLSPSDIHSVFPPDGSRGRFQHILSHVVMERSTLPWERSSSEVAEGNTPPWLALVLVEATEEQITHGKLADRRADAAGRAVKMSGSEPEHADDDETPVNVLTVPVAELPAPVDLRWQTHIREVDVLTHEGPSVRESAVLVAARVPEPGHRYRAHLVSIEGLYSGDDRNLAVRDDVSSATQVDLISLHSWDFTCQEDDHHGFVELLRTASHDVLYLPTPHGAEALGDFFRSGFVAMPERLRTGDTVTSWYHGPLVPSSSPASGHDLPVRSADHLLAHDHDSGLLDVSYAAAWQLGRMAALQNHRVATDLYAWKRTRAHDARHAEMRTATPDLPHLHSPRRAHDPDVHWRDNPPQPFPHADWVSTSLRRLGAVPFHYLVPDPAMLPPESMRLFTIDPGWVQCAIDGALSIGRVSEADLEADRELVTELSVAGGPLESRTMTGFLLRSDVVSGYPGMMIDGFASRVGGETKLGAVRVDRLAPGVLLVIFDGSFSRVRLHLHPQILHLEVPTTIAPGAMVSLSSLASTEQVITDPPGQTAHPRDLVRHLIAPTPSFDITKEST